ncbi:MAG: hypothetical protein WBD50_02110 [Candidatus Rhabdochlamydia sp.]
METQKQIPETFSVEQAYVIGMLFFLELWPLVEPRVIEEERLHGVYSLFFIDICSGDKYFGEAPHAEWNEAIRRTLHISKEEQKKLRLSLPEIFSCIMEFCKVHNERYNFKIAYAVHLLESMKKDPKNYKEEWAVWQETIEEPLDKYMDDDGFNWLDELPKQKTDAPKGDQL